MGRTSSVLGLLLAGSILPATVALSQDISLRPLPIRASLLPQAITAMRTDQADLQRAGFILKEGEREVRPGGGRERSYRFEGLSGSSATLVDKEYLPYVLGRRELVFDVIFSVKEGRAATDLAEITPQLIAAVQRAVSQSPAIVAGLGYLATASEPAVTPEALQTAVIDYVRQYRQPSNPPREACNGCGSQSGFSDGYSGSPEIYNSLNVRQTGWTIAGIRHYLKGDSVFTLQVIARIPRS